jgi:ATP-binding cassette, subfamily B, bacterial
MTNILSTKKTYIDPRDLPDVDRALLRRILAYLRPYRKQAGYVAAAVVVGALLNLLPPLFVKAIVDHLEGVVHRGAAGDGRLLVALCIGMIAGPLLASLLGLAQKYFATLIGEHVMLDLRLQVFEHLQRQSLRHFIQSGPGQLVSSVLNDVQGVGAVISTTLVAIVENAVVFLATAVLIIWLDWRLAIPALALLPFFIVPTRRAGSERKALRRAAQARMAELTGILTETLSVSGAYLIRVFGTERFETERLRTKGRELVESSLKQTLAGRRFRAFMGMFESVGPALAFGVGGFFILHGEQGLGTLVAFVTALKRLYAPASALAGVHVDLVTSYAYFERVFRVLDIEPEVRDAPDALRLTHARGEIVFEDVSLEFPGEGGVLRNIDGRIAPGECVAIVGPSGAGKSTLALLVSRIVDPSAGRVRLDGHDLRALELRSLRSHIAVVTQETYLFHASLLDNLRYARPTATLAEVELAARTAHIHDLIASLPDRYDTIVGDRGYRLSGGERQRVALARAVLKDPRILILDEATSSLDATNEALIQSSLDVLRRGRTSIVIAHRLSTVRRADFILVMDQGSIVERGTHSELLSHGGLYARMCADQPDEMHETNKGRIPMTAWEGAPH